MDSGTASFTRQVYGEKLSFQRVNENGWRKERPSVVVRFCGGGGGVGVGEGSEERWLAFTPLR